MDPYSTFTGMCTSLLSRPALVTCSYAVLRPFLLYLVPLFYILEWLYPISLLDRIWDIPLVFVCDVKS